MTTTAHSLSNTGRKDRFRLVQTGFCRFLLFLNLVRLATGVIENLREPQPRVRSFSVQFSSVSVFFRLTWTEPLNTNHDQHTEPESSTIRRGSSVRTTHIPTPVDNSRM